MPSGKALIEQINKRQGDNNNLAFWWLGQAGFVLKIAGTVIYIDPYLASDPERLVPPLLGPAEITNADVVLCTHDHGDHIDPIALRDITESSPKAIIIGPGTACRRIMDCGIKKEQITGLNPDESYMDHELKITGIKAKHEDFHEDKGLFPYLGYIIQYKKLCIYHSGDTLNYEGLLTCLKEFAVNIAFLPINGRDAVRFKQGCLGNMTYQEAVDLAGDLSVHTVVPMHYGMFAHNTEDPSLFVDYLQAKFPHINYWVGSPGEKVVVTIQGREK